MNKKQFLRECDQELSLMEDVSLHLYEVHSIFNHFIDILATALVEGDRVELRGFGVFIPIARRSFGGARARYIYRQRCFKPSPELCKRVASDFDYYEQYTNEGNPYESA